MGILHKSKVFIMGIFGLYKYSIRVYYIDIPEMSIGGEAMYPNINAERARLGLTAEQLAQKLGVTRKTLYNWSVKGDIPQAKLEQMARIFSCSVDYLLGH